MTRTPQRTTTTHERIALRLRQAVGSGELTPGGRLPPIAQMAREHGATPVTTRRALRELEAEGLVEVRHGVGTFVADWSRRYDGLALASFRDEAARLDLPTTAVVIERRDGVLHAEAAEALGVAPDIGLCVATRVRRIHEAPFAYQRSYMRAEHWPVLLDLDGGDSLYDILRRRTGRIPASSTESLRVVPLPNVAAESLGVASGSWGICSRRLTQDAGGAPVVYDEAWLPAERVELRIRRGDGEARVEYAWIEGAGELER